MSWIDQFKGAVSGAYASLAQQISSAVQSVLGLQPRPGAVERVGQAKASIQSGPATGAHSTVAAIDKIEKNFTNDPAGEPIKCCDGSSEAASHKQLANLNSWDPGAADEALRRELATYQAFKSRGVTDKNKLAALMGNAKKETDKFLAFRERPLSNQRVWELRGKTLSYFGVSQSDVMSASKSDLYDYMYQDIYRDKIHQTGNPNPGDGLKYVGRGAIHITGRDEYKRIGDKIGVDLISNPELLTNIDVSADASIAYWNGKNLDKVLKDSGIDGVSTAIKGSDDTNAERRTYYNEYLNGRLDELDSLL